MSQFQLVNSIASIIPDIMQAQFSAGGTAGAVTVVAPAGPGVIPGGTINQLLAKASLADFDTKWVSSFLSTYTLPITVGTDLGGDPANPYVLGSNGEDVLLINNQIGGALYTYIGIDDTSPPKDITVTSINSSSGDIVVAFSSTVGLSLSYAFNISPIWPTWSGHTIQSGYVFPFGSIVVFGGLADTPNQWPIKIIQTRHRAIKWNGAFDTADYIESRWTLNSTNYNTLTTAFTSGTQQIAFPLKYDASVPTPVAGLAILYTSYETNVDGQPVRRLSVMHESGNSMILSEDLI